MIIEWDEKFGDWVNDSGMGALCEPAGQALGLDKSKRYRLVAGGENSIAGTWGDYVLTTPQGSVSFLTLYRAVSELVPHDWPLTFSAEEVS